MVERLWTPWRSAYVGGERTAEGSLFETLAADANDEANLILLRGERCFVIMNLFPYNTGHVMVVPYRKVADPTELTPDEWRELGELTARLTAALRATLGPDGFNIGMNVGTAAGAGIPDHLHLHIVPRWAGDTNFMPVLGATKVLPELVPETYARLRRALAAAGERGGGEAGEPAGDAGDAAAAEAEAAAAASASGAQVVAETESVEEVAASPAVGVAAAAAATAAAEATAEATAGPASEPPTPQAGAVVLLRDKVALRLTRDQAWVLPKGHIEPGETPEQAAVREVAEEMGLSGVLGHFIDELRFVQGKRERQVRYYLFRAERPLPSWGDHLGRDAFLFSPREALTRLTHADARALLERALALAGMK